MVRRQLIPESYHHLENYVLTARKDLHPRVEVLTKNIKYFSALYWNNWMAFSTAFQNP